MDLSPLLPVLTNILLILAGLFVVAIGLAVLALIVLYILDGISSASPVDEMTRTAGGQLRIVSPKP